MLRIRTATPLDGRRLRVTLSDKSVVERDVAEFISWGPGNDFLGLKLR